MMKIKPISVNFMGIDEPNTIALPLWYFLDFSLFLHIRFLFLFFAIFFPLYLILNGWLITLSRFAIIGFNRSCFIYYLYCMNT